MPFRTGFVAALGALLGGLAACSDNATAPTPLTALVSVTPAGNATGVNRSAPISMQFSHAMQPRMEAYVSLHEGDATGPVVAATCAWSSDQTTLTCTPTPALKGGTHYALHIGGGMKDVDGNPIDMNAHGPQMGGQWATCQMMTGGMMGCGPSGSEMGPGWQGTNGMYGMVFGFTTA